MARKYEPGEELTGIVSGIQPYGAFIALDEETQGLIHISEITYGFVKDINEFLKIGEEVEVEVLEVDEVAGKISLSIRALLEVPTIPYRDEEARRPLQDRIDEGDSEGFNSLKEKLEEWISQSGQ